MENSIQLVKKGVHTKKKAPKSAPKGNQYAKGNKGGHGRNLIIGYNFVQIILIRGGKIE
jgi:hypothetical protein